MSYHRKTPKSVFNYIAVYDESSSLWYVYHKLDKRIPKTRDHYGSKYISKGESLESTLALAHKKGVAPYDVQIIKKVVSNE